MRILLVSTSRKNPDAGASRVYHLLERGLTARGHEVTILHYEDLKLSGPTERFTSRLLLPQAVSREVAKQGIESFDVIMTSAGSLYPYFKRLQPLVKRPLLVNHSHGSSFFNHITRLNEAMRGHGRLSAVYRNVTGPLIVHWENQGLKYADITVVQNNRDLDLFTEREEVPVVNVPLTVHPDLLEAGYNSPSPEEKDPLSLLWFGSWSERKGAYYLPRAFKRIVDRQPNATLTLWGTGAGTDEIRNHFEPELWPKISVRPFISRPEQIAEYARFSIFLFPSLSEGFPLSLNEVMSMGLAIIATDAGFSGDWLRDGENARIVPGGSSYHLANAALELIEDDALRCKIARNGQQLSRLFTFERMIDSYESVFATPRRR